MQRHNTRDESYRASLAAAFGTLTRLATPAPRLHALQDAPTCTSSTQCPSGEWCGSNVGAGDERDVCRSVACIESEEVEKRCPPSVPVASATPSGCTSSTQCPSGEWCGSNVGAGDSRDVCRSVACIESEEVEKRCPAGVPVASATPAAGPGAGFTGDVSAECLRGLEELGRFKPGQDLERCGYAFDLNDYKIPPKSREEALCAADTGCLDVAVGAFKACEADFGKIDPSGGFAAASVVVHAFRDLCPSSPGGSDGCFVAAAEYERNFAMIDWDNSLLKPTQLQLKSLCEDTCTRKVQQFFLKLVSASGDERAVEEARAHLDGRNVVCTKDSSGYYCYGDLKDLEAGENWESEKICPNMCVRKAFLKFVGSLGGASTRSDFKKFFRFLCAKNDADKYCAVALEEMEGESDDGSGGVLASPCNDYDYGQVEICLREAESLATCTDLRSASGDVNPGMSCACADAILACYDKKVSPTCLAGEINREGCSAYLTTCPTACAALPAFDPSVIGGECDRAVYTECSLRVGASQCPGMVNDDGSVKAEIPCDCVDKIIDCQQERLPTSCWASTDDAYFNCRSSLRSTMCVDSCEKYAPILSSEDDATAVGSSGCPADQSQRQYACNKEVNALSECAGTVMSDGVTVNPEASCACLDKIIQCQQRAIHTSSCTQSIDWVRGCREALKNTKCPDSCEFFRPGDAWGCPDNTVDIIGACINDGITSEACANDANCSCMEKINSCIVSRINKPSCTSSNDFRVGCYEGEGSPVCRKSCDKIFGSAAARASHRVLTRGKATGSDASSPAAAAITASEVQFALVVHRAKKRRAVTKRAARILSRVVPSRTKNARVSRHLRVLQDKCDVTSTQCSAACQAEVDAAKASLGCCVFDLATYMSGISFGGPLEEFRKLASIVKTVGEACGESMDESNICMKKGKVQGRLALAGLDKATVDKNKVKFYSDFASDLSSNVGVAEEDVTVTGHESIDATATRLRRRRSHRPETLATGSGVVFNYEIATEDPTVASSVESEINSDVQSGTLDLPATTSEIAKTNPEAATNVKVDASNSEATDASSEPATSSIARVAPAAVVIVISVYVLAAVF